MSQLFARRKFICYPSAYATLLQESQPNSLVFEVMPQIQNQERSDCTPGSSRLVLIVFFSLACSRFAPGSVKVLAAKQEVTDLLRRFPLGERC